jgi:queuine tRNA-ribosyltransferase
MERTHRWLIASKEAHSKDSDSVYGYPQALFGIIQGGNFRDLREQSAAFMLDMELDGLAIGGESIGFDMAKTCTILEWLTPILPANQSRYTMGVGLCPDDLLAVVSQGIDLFDCVAPTRNARHGALYHGEIVKQNNWVSFVSDQPRKRLLIKKSCYARDSRPISEHCGCYTCQNFSRAYLHYLFKGGFAAYNNLACIHNIYVMQAICDAMRECILST